MQEFKTEKIKNVAILGHLGSGKTSLSESLLYISKTTDKKGDIEHKSTVSDYMVEEQSRLSSVSSSIIPVLYKDYKINFIDVPGSEEFVGDLNNVLSIVKGAIILIDASSKVQVGTERFWRECHKRNIPTIVFVNKMDKENIKVEELLDDILEKLGKSAIPFTYPTFENDKFVGFEDLIDGNTRDDIKNQILEMVAETSDELMEKYFGGEPITEEEMNLGLTKSLVDGKLCPVLFGSATSDIGIEKLLDTILRYFPKQTNLKPLKGINPDKNKEETRTTNESEPFSGYVFKTLVDPFLGVMSLFKVSSGKINLGDEIYLPATGKVEKVNSLFILRGKTQIPVDKLVAGDLGGLNKINDLTTGQTICDKKNKIQYNKVNVQTPTMYIAIEPKNKQDEDKISGALQKLNMEDQSFEIRRNKETSQLLIGGQGNVHIQLILDRMKNMFKVDVTQQDQKIVYRETIKQKAEAEGRYIKQSGGSGQYGVVAIEFEPCDEQFVFAERVFGGAVPKNFFPAVEKGLNEAMEHGPLAGFPVINIKCTLFDGKYHPVDSSEQSFKMAAIMAFRKACEENKIKSTILEPIMKVKVLIKDEYVGDIMGDIPQRRGNVMGMNPVGRGKTAITAEIPEAEITSYAIDLKAMTQGSGHFTRKFIRYADVPENLVKKIIEEYKPKQA